jgi:hypothetical protein
VEHQGESAVFGRAMKFLQKEHQSLTRIIQDMEDQRQKRFRKLRLYGGISGDTHTCQEQLQQSTDENDIISDLALEDFKKLKRDTLKAFVGVRTQKYLRILIEKLEQRHDRRCTRWKSDLTGVQSKKRWPNSHCKKRDQTYLSHTSTTYGTHIS